MNALRRIANLPTVAGTLLIKTYRVVFFWLPSSCRFEPSCSNYALVCLERHGAWRGVRLSVWRILRCQPLCAGGHDPPP